MALLCIPVSELVSCTFSTIPICPFLIQRIFSFTCIYICCAALSFKNLPCLNCHVHVHAFWSRHSVYMYIHSPLSLQCLLHLELQMPHCSTRLCPYRQLYTGSVETTTLYTSIQNLPKLEVKHTCTCTLHLFKGPSVYT